MSSPTKYFVLEFEDKDKICLAQEQKDKNGKTIIVPVNQKPVFTKQEFIQFVNGLKNDKQNFKLITWNQSYTSFQKTYNIELPINSLYSLKSISANTASLPEYKTIDHLHKKIQNKNTFLSFCEVASSDKVASAINLLDNLINVYSLNTYIQTSPYFPTTAKLVETILCKSDIRDESPQIKYFTPWKFKPTNPTIKKVFELFDNSEIKTPDDRAKIAKEFDLNGLTLRTGTGGLHAALENFSTNKTVWHVDAESLYPSIIIKCSEMTKYTKFFPKNFDIEKYKQIYFSRINKKRILAMLEADGKINQANLINPENDFRLKQVLATNDLDKIKAYASNQDSEKLVLNNAYGILSASNSAFYNPAIQKNISFAGQQLILGLADKLLAAGVIETITQFNTDAIDFIPKPDKIELAQKVINDFQKETGFVFSPDYYAQLAQVNVNNYLAVEKNGSIHAKGPEFKDYQDNVLTNKKIIDKANVNYLTKKVPLADTINNSTQVSDFCTLLEPSEDSKILTSENQAYTKPMWAVIVKEKQPSISNHSDEEWKYFTKIPPKYYASSYTKISQPDYDFYTSNALQNAQADWNNYNQIDKQTNKPLLASQLLKIINSSEQCQKILNIKQKIANKTAKLTQAEYGLNNRLILESLIPPNLYPQYISDIQWKSLYSADLSASNGRKINDIIKQVINAKTILANPTKINLPANFDSQRVREGYVKISSNKDIKFPLLPENNTLILEGNIKEDYELVQKNGNLIIKDKKTKQEIGTIDTNWYLNKCIEKTKPLTPYIFKQHKIDSEIKQDSEKNI